MRSPSWDQPQVTLPQPHGAIQGCRGCLAVPRRKAKLPPRCILAESSADFSPISQVVRCQPGKKEKLRVPFLLGINCMARDIVLCCQVAPAGAALALTGLWALPFSACELNGMQGRFQEVVRPGCRNPQNLSLRYSGPNGHSHPLVISLHKTWPGCLGSRLGGRGPAAQMCAPGGLSAEPRGVAGHLPPHRSRSCEK